MKPRIVRTSNKTSKAEAHRQKLRAAMPEVRALCEKRGRSIVLSCVTRIAEYEKKAAQVERLRAEADALAKKLLDEGEKAVAI